MIKIAKLALIFFFAIRILSAEPVAERTILSLIKQFSNEDPFVAGEAVTALANVGGPAVEYLMKSLADENDNVRWCSAMALAKIAPAGAQAIHVLNAALKDKNPDVRWCSALALGKFNGDAASAVPELLNLLNDDDRDVRWAAYIALDKIDKDKINITPEFSSVIEKLEKLTPQFMKELKVPGVSISLIKNHELAWSKSFGVSDAIAQTNVNNKTVFEACSMSKPVFAYLALKLIEQGKLALDEPLCDYLDEQFVNGEDDYAKLITARMILSHTSGMPNWRKGGEERGGPLPVYFKPGTRFSYSGEGIYYLQRVVEHITKEPLATYAKRNLFDPLGLESTSYIWTETLNPQIATGHDSAGNCLKRSKYTHANAAYTLYTTPDEYAKFIIKIMKPNQADEFSLSGKMTNEMVTHQVRMDVRDVIDRPGRFLGLVAYRGLGWVIDSTITGDIIYHSGSNQTGFTCYSQFNTREGSGIVIMTNGKNGSDLWAKLISVVGDL
jgi:CubicO group peptidase (beta-lactamase class C family)